MTNSQIFSAKLSVIIEITDSNNTDSKTTANRPTVMDKRFGYTRDSQTFPGVPTLLHR